MRETYAVLNRDILHHNISISICFIVLFNYNRIPKVRFTDAALRYDDHQNGALVFEDLDHSYVPQVCMSIAKVCGHLMHQFIWRG